MDVYLFSFIVSVIMFCAAAYWYWKPSQVSRKTQTNSSPAIVRTEQDGGSRSTWIDIIYADGTTHRVISIKSGGETVDTKTKWFKDGDSMTPTTRPRWA